MEEMIGTSNINETWLKNIYENIKALENYERLIREGCSSIMDYMQIPLNKRNIIIGLTQFKNLKFFLTEFKLLLADLTPILEKTKAEGYENTIKEIDKALKSQNLFIKSIYNANRQLIESKPTEFFYITIDVLHDIKKELFKDIKHILYIDNKEI